MLKRVLPYLFCLVCRKAFKNFSLDKDLVFLLHKYICNHIPLTELTYLLLTLIALFPAILIFWDFQQLVKLTHSETFLLQIRWRFSACINESLCSFIYGKDTFKISFSYRNINSLSSSGKSTDIFINMKQLWFFVCKEPTTTHCSSQNEHAE